MAKIFKCTVAFNEEVVCNMAIIGLIGSVPIVVVIIIFIVCCIFADAGNEECRKQVEEASDFILKSVAILLLLIGCFIYVIVP